jgi:hypothetical protein
MIIMRGDEFNMNNTKTLAIAAILIAGTLVVGGTLAATSATSAFAYQKKRGQDDSKNGNTVTIQACKQRGSVSGHDNTLGQECGNTICTHPSSGATCVSEGSEAVTPVIEECGPGFLYDVTLRATVVGKDTTITKGTELCLPGHPNALGNQIATIANATDGTIRVVVDHPNPDSCGGSAEIADVTSGKENVRFTSVCVMINPAG